MYGRYLVSKDDVKRGYVGPPEGCGDHEGKWSVDDG